MVFKIYTNQTNITHISVNHIYSKLYILDTEKPKNWFKSYIIRVNYIIPETIKLLNV